MAQPESNAALTCLAKYRIGPEQFKKIKDTNEQILSAARKCALGCVTPDIVFAKPDSNDGYYRIETKGKIICVSEDAPEVALHAAEFLMARAMLDRAIKEGDIPVIRELAIYLGVSAVDTMLESRSGVRMHYLLTKYTAGKCASRKGGKSETVWGPVEKLARPIFARFKSGKGVSDTAAIKRTKGELVRLKREGNLNYKVPGLTCLRDHLVKKPSAGK